jgi:hypothetical protein
MYGTDPKYNLGQMALAGLMGGIPGFAGSSGRLSWAAPARNSTNGLPTQNCE